MSEQVKRGDILLYKGKGFVSHMIRVVTKSKWSHAAWVLDGNQLLESDWELFGKKGVQIEDMKTYKKKRSAFVRVNVPEEAVESALNIAMSKLGQRYDFRLFFGLFWQWLKCICCLGFHKPVRDSRRGWICSELISIPLHAACKYQFRDDIPVKNTVPGDIWSAIETDRAESLLI